MGEGTMGGETNQGRRTHRQLAVNLLLPGCGELEIVARMLASIDGYCVAGSCCLLELVTGSCLSLLSGWERNQATQGQGIGWKKKEKRLNERTHRSLLTHAKAPTCHRQIEIEEVTTQAGGRDVPVAYIAAGGVRAG
jgi:hypothetical protein